MCVYVCVCARCKVLEGHKGHRGAQEKMNANAAVEKPDHIAMISKRVHAIGDRKSLDVETGNML